VLESATITRTHYSTSVGHATTRPKSNEKKQLEPKETHALHNRPERGIDTEISNAGRSDVSAMCVPFGKATVPAGNVDRELVLPSPRRLFLRYLCAAAELGQAPPKG
jgi:hypothetical protein